MLGLSFIHNLKQDRGLHPNRTRPLTLLWLVERSNRRYK